MKEQSVEQLPYVVSGDIQLLMGNWATRRGFTLPDDSYFEEFRLNFAKKMREIFPKYDFVSETEIKNGLQLLTKNLGKEKITPVSLDGVYFESPFKLGFSRAVDEKGEDKGLIPRAGYPCIYNQYWYLRENLFLAGLLKKPVALIDDVIFTGNLISQVNAELKRQGIKVARVYCGIAVDTGVKLLKKQGLEVVAVRNYEKGVIDEVCERDFFPGIPLGGKSLYNNPFIGVPYTYRENKLKEWASIPGDKAYGLSGFCYRAAIDLFDRIGRISDRRVLCADLDRQLINYEYLDLPFTNALWQSVSGIITG